MEILRSFCVLLGAQLVGEALHRGLHLPVPGSALGMALLAAVLLMRKREPGPALTRTSDLLLRWLGLMFVPAGAGVVAALPTLRAQWLPVVVALVVSTLLTLVVTALVMHLLGRRAAVSQ